MIEFFLDVLEGGRNEGSQGLEAFNIKDGSVTILSDLLPPEEATGNHLQVRFQTTK